MKHADIHYILICFNNILPLNTHHLRQKTNTYFSNIRFFLKDFRICHFNLKLWVFIYFLAINLCLMYNNCPRNFRKSFHNVYKSKNMFLHKHLGCLFKRFKSPFNIFNWSSTCQVSDTFYVWLAYCESENERCSRRSWALSHGLVNC